MYKKQNQRAGLQTGALKNSFKVDAKKNSPSLKMFVLFLGILSFCIYANTLENEFALDDLAAIQQNQLVRKGMSAIPEILVTPYHFGDHVAKDDGTAI